jgi:cystathionine gamma-synthase
MKSPATLHPETLTAQAMGDVDPVTKAITPALHPSTTYLRDPDNQYRNKRSYARADNPTFDTAEALLTALEGAAASLSFASGMAAASAAFLALEPGAHVIAPTIMYWGLRKWLKGTGSDCGLQVDFVDIGDLTGLAAATVKGKTKLIWLETPSNPTWAITDIAGAAEIAHRAGARLAVDSTVATPILTRPLALGADLVMHSATKYLNGHSDVVAGMLATARLDGYWERVIALRSGNGGILGTFEAWLLQRGMRTLALRVERASRTALTLARHFQGHRHLAAVLYPGLPEFPGHDLARRQMQGGFGGMLSIRTRGGEAAAIATAASVELWQRATSLGGVESLIEHRRSVEGNDSPCPPDLLRLSAGLEHAQDLIADLEQALARAHN